MNLIIDEKDEDKLNGMTALQKEDILNERFQKRKTLMERYEMNKERKAFMSISQQPGKLSQCHKVTILAKFKESLV